jgi:hypothetical protein
MSRFEQDIEVGLRQIADRATPSPDVWASIQHRIDHQEPTQETEIIMLTENTIRPRRWPMLAAAAAVAALLVGGIALVNRGDGVEVPADTPPPTVSAAPVIEPEVAEPEGDAAETQVAEPEVVELPSVDQQVNPGTYSTDALGVPFTLDVPDGAGGTFTRGVTRTGAIQLVVRDGILETISIGRVGSFYGSAEASEGTTQGLGSIAADDIDGWIKNNDITVDQESEVTVGDRPAKLRQVRFDNKHPNGFWGFSGSADVAPIKPEGFYGHPDTVYPIWLISMDDFEPILIWAVSNIPDQQQWINDIVIPLVDSIEFGEPAPAVEGGTARVPLRVAETGAFEAVRVDGEPLADGSVPVTSTITLTGGVAGEITGVGAAVSQELGIEEEGFDENTFTGTIDGVGTGTMTYRLDWELVGGVYSSTGLVTGGTGDLAGATGTVTTSIRSIERVGLTTTGEGTITFFLALPRSG